MKTILHLCADIGSDSYYYSMDDAYEVVKVGKEIGVENYSADREVHGIIANPVCTEFSTVSGFHVRRNPDISMLLDCLRIITEAKPVWYVIENPFNGVMKDFLGKPDYVYQPWEFGSPWTKKTALWGRFNKPKKIYSKWEDVDKNDNLYIRPGRKKPSLAFLHKSAIAHIDEFDKFKGCVQDDNGFRSLCSQGFAKEFYNANR